MGTTKHAGPRTYCVLWNDWNMGNFIFSSIYGSTYEKVVQVFHRTWSVYCMKVAMA